MSATRSPLTRRERQEQVRDLVTSSPAMSDAQIAERLQVSTRTVLRDRTEMQLPPGKPRRIRGSQVGSSCPHGTESRYGYGCRCADCRAGHAEYTRRKLHEAGRWQRYRVPCRTCGRSHLVETLTEFTTCPT